MKKLQNRTFLSILVAVVAMSLFSCTGKSPVAPTMEQIVEVPASGVQIDQAVEPEKTEVEILLELGRDLENNTSPVEVLRLYAKALKIADQGEEEMVRAYLNRFLATVDDAELESLSASESLEIPRAEIMYRLGLNYGAQGKNQSAIDILAQFLKDYPDHLDAENATQILLLVQEHLFRKDTVGYLLPMSGKFSIFGERALKGIELAVQDLSRQFDQKITVMIRDTKSDDAQAINLVQELASQKVAGIAGAIITSEAAAREAQNQGVPIIVMTQKSQVAKIGDFVFSNFLTPEIQTETLASYALRMLDVEKFAILYPDDRYGITYMNLFRDRVEEMGGEVVGSESYGKDETDFSDAIIKLAAMLSPMPESLETPEQVEALDLDQDMGAQVQTRPLENQLLQEDPPKDDLPDFESTAFFIPDSPSKVGMILPQLAYHDVTGCYLLGTNLWHNDLLISGAKKYAAKAVITDGFFAGGSNQKARSFAERFKALYGQTPGFIEAVAYDNLILLVQTAMESGVNSRVDLKKALAGQRIFEGVTGLTMFDPDGNAQKELVLITIKQGEFHEIDR